jgi:hypothetical protein
MVLAPDDRFYGPRHSLLNVTCMPMRLLLACINGSLYRGTAPRHQTLFFLRSFFHCFSHKMILLPSPFLIRLLARPPTPDEIKEQQVRGQLQATDKQAQIAKKDRELS